MVRLSWALLSAALLALLVTGPAPVGASPLPAADDGTGWVFNFGPTSLYSSPDDAGDALASLQQLNWGTPAHTGVLV